MRINVYGEELTNEITFITKEEKQKMTSFNFGANDKQPKLPFEEKQNEKEHKQLDGNSQKNEGIEGVGNETTGGNEEEKTKSKPAVQVGLCNGDNKQGSEQQTTLPDSGYRYPD